uniref:Uncharacterized protein n=1 Tax=Acrobeloides nanus TaxID=290746 RepID=A0A914CFB3_9BILA
MLVFLAKHPLIDKYDLSSVEIIFTGAAPAGSDLIEEVKRRLPNLKFVVQGYGMTEVGLASHLPILSKKHEATVGKIASNFEMKIVDVDTRKPLSPNQRGEICVRGPTIMRGYLNQPETTSDTIDSDGWLKTGDIGYMTDDGFLYVVDRLKELIKVKGFQVPPAELEDLLLSHPGVKDCAVIGVQHARHGEVPKAFVVRKNVELAENELIEFIKGCDMLATALVTTIRKSRLAIFSAFLV